MVESKLIKYVVSLGDKYTQNSIQAWDPNILDSDWWNALIFFFEHSFMRGRNDKLSIKYKEFTIKSLEELFNINNVSRKTAYTNLQKYRPFYDKNIILDFKDKYKLKRANSINKNYRPQFKTEVLDKNFIIQKLITERPISYDFKGKKENI